MLRPFVHFARPDVLSVVTRPENFRVFILWRAKSGPGWYKLKIVELSFIWFVKFVQYFNLINVSRMIRLINCFINHPLESFSGHRTNFTNLTNIRRLGLNRTTRNMKDLRRIYEKNILKTEHSMLPIYIYFASWKVI